MARRPPEKEAISLDCGRRTTQLMRDPLGGSTFAMLTIPVLLLTLLGSAASTPPPCARLCSCTWEHDPQKALQTADAVLDATALDSTLQFPRDSGASFLELYHVRILVGRVWKGSVSDTLTIYTGWGEAGCGLDFRPAHRFLLFLYRSQTGHLIATYCSLSRPLESSESVLQSLGEPLHKGAT